mmetsp:Transcript_87769/g.190062  ORF Transcript_87769/g.190062 Transcript_87769/m.190062 type:complete len:152 (+) Transcript_87769:99-554(+)
MCVSVFIVGLIVNVIQGSPKIEPLAMVGGFVWAAGNACTVPIIKRIGIATGILIWGCVSILFGWFIPRFGLFGIKEQLPSTIWLNYLGIVLIIICIALFALVESNEETADIIVRKESLSVLKISQSSNKFGSSNNMNSQKKKTRDNNIVDL